MTVQKDIVALLALRLPNQSQQITPRDAAIYAMGIGIGDTPDEPADLPWLLGPSETFPSMATVLCHPRSLLKQAVDCVNFTRTVHSRQELALCRPIPSDVAVSPTARVTDVRDLGPGRGAMLRLEREIVSADDGGPLVNVINTIHERGGGGFGGPPPTTRKAASEPKGLPDRIERIVTNPNLALMHLLSGDLNPLHADPDHARRVGFSGPILRGLATYGLLARAILKATGRRFSRLAVDFSTPAFPGDTLTVDLWKIGGDELACSARVKGRDALVLKRGPAVLGERAS